MLNNFIYAKLKLYFEKLLEANNIYPEAIAFIEDTKEIWTHGLYYGAGGKGFITEEGLAETLKNFEDSLETIYTALTVKGNVLAIDTEEELDNIPKLEGKLILDVPNDTIVLLPNKYYKKTTPTTNLTIQLAEDITDVVSEYCIEFVTAADGTAVTLPDSIKWLNGEIPEFENGCIYLISVIRGLGVCAKFV